ncbi:MAG: L,D-transpeptidase [Legionellales bacterium]|nr:L,D-transpeptidase [Legionellales bacterium]|tara:strand:- start:441 stop:920 length:480 start_codon:yes stop_codon:yes gene_type:complete
MIQIVIKVSNQKLYLNEGSNCLKSWDISTAKNGVGQNEGSFQTPLGKHIVRAKIGHDIPKGGVLVGRRFTGEVYSEDLASQWPKRDWILTRILWLSGCELHRNRLGDCDTMRRYIYIHGTPDTEPMGEPHSHGCIRMRNDAITELFELIPPYTSVLISE